jgi:hypothetical protein
MDAGHPPKVLYGSGNYRVTVAAPMAVIIEFQPATVRAVIFRERSA